MTYYFRYLMNNKVFSLFLTFNYLITTNIHHKTYSSEMGTLVKEAPLFTFGVIADIQYADRNDALNYPRTVVRHYRNARTLTKLAYEYWSSLPARDPSTDHMSPNWPRPDFVLQLGDLIDGWNSRKSKHAAAALHETPQSGAPRSQSHESISERAVSSLAPSFSILPAPTFHVWGNHELYCFTRSQLLAHPVLGSSVRSLGFPSVQNASESLSLERLGFRSSTRMSLDSQPQLQLMLATAPEPERSTPNVFPGYYSFTYPLESSSSSSADESGCGARSVWRFVALDTYEVTPLGYAPHEAPFIEAQKTLELRNPNEDKNSPIGLEFPRYSAFNAGVSSAQLDWLEAQLQSARSNRERVVVFTHAPFAYGMIMYEDSESWSAPELMAVVSRFDDVVALVLAGHDHFLHILAQPFRPLCVANANNSSADASQTIATVPEASSISSQVREPPPLPDDPRTSRPAASACKVGGECDCMTRNGLVSASPVFPPTPTADGLYPLLTYAAAESDSALPRHVRAPLHLVVPAVLEAPTDRDGVNAAATVAVFADRLEVRGVGTQPRVPHIVLHLC